MPNQGGNLIRDAGVARKVQIAFADHSGELHQFLIVLGPLVTDLAGQVPDLAAASLLHSQSCKSDYVRVVLVHCLNESLVKILRTGNVG